MITEILYPVAALSGMGLVFGAGLAYASKVFAAEEDPRATAIRAALPGANCGGCGYSGCDGFAEAAAAGSAAPGGCPVGGAQTAAVIAGIMGVETEETVEKAARVMCNGKDGVSRYKFEYYGMEDCGAAAQLFAGRKHCTYGCLGLGSCEKVCPFGAIAVTGGVARVVESRCKACGRCAAVCPKSLIELVPVSKEFSVMCRSKDRGPVTKNNCEVGCIGCAKCVKACRYGAIGMQGSLAKIDYHQCVNCGECTNVCPVMAVRRLNYNGRTMRE